MKKSTPRYSDNPRAERLWNKVAAITPIAAASIVVWGSLLTGALLARFAPIEQIEALPDNDFTQAILDERVASADVEELAPLPASPAMQSAMATTGRTRRTYGTTPAMFNAIVRAAGKAKIAVPVFLQGIGDARASAGAHARDGYVIENGQRYAYTTSVDLRSRDVPNDAGRRRFLSALADEGYGGWYRHKGSFAANRHFHIVFAKYHMKAMTRAQLVDFINGKTGLVGHKRETFWQPSVKQKQYIRALYLKSNPPSKVKKQGMVDLPSLRASRDPLIGAD